MVAEHGEHAERRAQGAELARDVLGRHAPAPQRVRVDVVAEQEHHVGRLVVEPLDRARDRLRAGVRRARVDVGQHAEPHAVERRRPARQLEPAADGHEPPRLDPAGPGERRGGRERGDRPHSAASTSSRRGMPARAPAARVDSAAAAIANRAASRSGRPAASSAASAPLTASPAPVVSTTSTAGAGSRSAVAVEQQRALRAERHEHRRAGPRRQRARRGLDVLLAGQRPRLVGVRREDHAVEVLRQPPRGRGVEHHAPARLAAGADPGDDDRLRHLVAEQDDAVAAAPDQARHRLLDDRRVELRVGARGDRDLKFSPALVDHDRRHARSALRRAARRRPRRCPPRRARAAPRRRGRPRRPRPPSPRCAPARAAATAWLAPLPPPWRANVPPVTVSPARGSARDRDHEVGVDRPYDDDRGLRHGRRGYGARVAKPRRGRRVGSARSPATRG